MAVRVIVFEPTSPLVGVPETVLVSASNSTQSGALFKVIVSSEVSWSTSLAVITCEYSSPCVPSVSTSVKLIVGASFTLVTVSVNV